MRRPYPFALRDAFGLALISALAVTAAPALGFAQEACSTDSGGIPSNYGSFQDVFPAGNEIGVPINGFIRVRYLGRAPAGGFFRVVQVTTGGLRTPVEGSTNTIGAEIHWQSARPLQQLTQYEVTVPDIAGGSSSNAFSFTTGSQTASSAPPTFTGLTETPTFTRNGTSDRCGDPNAVTIGLQWPRAGNNGWPFTDIEYIVYQTRGPGIGGPVERYRARGFDSGSTCTATNNGQCASFRLSSTNASAPTCFNVQAVDPYGRADLNGAELCIDPSVGNFFVGCSAAPPGQRQTTRGLLSVIAVGLLAGATTLFIRGRRRRS